MSATFAVIGAGPIGSCTAYAIAQSLETEGRSARVLLIDANDPLGGEFGALRAAGPYAAGQLMLHVFEEGSPAKDLTRRSHDRLRYWAAGSGITLYRRPWLCCTGDSGSELDDTAQEVVRVAFAEGRFDGCRLLARDQVPDVAGLRRDAVALAIFDPHTLAVNPPVFVSELAQLAAGQACVEPRFHSRVDELGSGYIRLTNPTGHERIEVDGIALCTGIHRELLPGDAPPSRPEFLHVIDHADRNHSPQVHNLITGETTIARYAGFGPKREALTALLPEEVRRFGIHALFTDVPGLRRLLDSHFANEQEAKASTQEVHRLLVESAGRYIPEPHLPQPDGSEISYIAAYLKLLDMDGPIVQSLSMDGRVIWVQPSNGLGLNQCAALGEDAAKLVLGM